MSKYQYARRDMGEGTSVLEPDEYYLEDVGNVVLSTATCYTYGLDQETTREAATSWVVEHAEDIAKKRLKEKFDRLADRWQEETKFLSSAGEIVRHPAHLEIIAMGPSVVPLILNRMKHRRGLWFHALYFLTGDNPVAEGIRGNIEAMTQAWLEWGRRHEYC